MNGNLPFPRGTTYFDGDTSRANSSGTVKCLLGQRFTVKNDGNIGGYGHDNSELTLMTVQNLTGSSLSNLRGVTPSTGSTASTYNIGAAASAGGAGWLLDDAYSGVTIVNKDIFYVVLEGTVKSEVGSSAAIIANKGVKFSAGGKLIDMGTSTSEFHCVGVGGENRASAASGTHVLFHVGPMYLTGAT